MVLDYISVLPQLFENRAPRFWGQITLPESVSVPKDLLPLNRQGSPLQCSFWLTGAGKVYNYLGGGYHQPQDTTKRKNYVQG